MKTKFFLIAVLFSTLGAIAQQKQDKFIVNGNIVEATLYHDNGVVSQTGFYNEAGKLQGEWISYDTKGIKTAVANYLNGEKVGTWLFFVDDKIKEVSYSNSKIYKVKTLAVTDIYIASNR